MDMNATFSILTPKKILAGNNAVENVGREAIILGANKVLIITDIGIAKAGIVDKVKKLLEQENLKVGVFEGVEPEPRTKVVYNCIKKMEKENYNLLVGLGGGSVIDVTKAVSVLITNKGSLDDYFGLHDIAP